MATAGGSDGEIPGPDFSVLKTVARNQLIHIIESLPEPKDLILDDDLIRPLDRIIGASVLKSHGISSIFKLERGKTPRGSLNRLYLFRPSVQNAVIISSQIREDQNGSQEGQYRLVMTPRRSALCERIFEREGVYSSVSFEEFNMDLVPLDDGLLSMEYPRFFHEYFVESDFECMKSFVNSLVTLESIYGKFANIHTFGECAQSVWEIKKKYQQESLERDNQRVTTEMSTLIVIDRDVDYVSALLSPLTYEGLLDDHFGIQSGTVDFEPNLSGQSKAVRWILNSQDEVFRDIRDKHFATVFTFLSHKAKEIQAIYNRRNEMKSVQDMKTFVSTHLKGTSSQHRSLGLHISACELVMKEKSTEGDFENQLRCEHTTIQGLDMKLNQQFIEESIMRMFPVQHVLRLMCLYSVTWGGNPHKLYHQLKTEFLQSYGYEHLLTFHNLKRAGLLYEQPENAVNLSKVGVRKSKFSQIAKQLNLLPSRKIDCDLRNPKDVSFVSNGCYIPLSYRLVEQMLTTEKLPGLSNVLKELEYHSYEQDVYSASPVSDRNVLVYFLGGCSYTEVACLRFLSRMLRVNISVASDSFFGSDRFIRRLLPREATNESS